jgi:hypothetical protein
MNLNRNVGVIKTILIEFVSSLFGLPLRQIGLTFEAAKILVAV